MDVLLSLREAQVHLGRGSPRPAQGVVENGYVQLESELAREDGGLMEPSLPLAIGVQGHRYDDVNLQVWWAEHLPAQSHHLAQGNGQGLHVLVLELMDRFAQGTIMQAKRTKASEVRCSLGAVGAIRRASGAEIGWAQWIAAALAYGWAHGIDLGLAFATQPGAILVADYAVGWEQQISDGIPERCEPSTA
jgi:hypothetical protein